MKKRVLAFLLTLCMLITLVPAESMLATEAQAEIGTETEANIESEVDEEKKGQEGDSTTAPAMPASTTTSTTVLMPAVSTAPITVR